MHRLAPLLFLLLSACGLKGPLYEQPPAGAPAATPAPATDDTANTDKGERKTIPATPDPAQSL